MKPTTPILLSNISCAIFFCIFFFHEYHTRFSEVFYLLEISLDKAIIFQIHLGIHQRETGENFVYDHLYFEEASSHLDVCPRPFNRRFLVIIKTIYLAILIYACNNIYLYNINFPLFTRKI